MENTTLPGLIDQERDSFKAALQDIGVQEEPTPEIIAHAYRQLPGFAQILNDHSERHSANGKSRPKLGDVLGKVLGVVATAGSVASALKGAQKGAQEQEQQQQEVKADEINSKRKTMPNSLKMGIVVVVVLVLVLVAVKIFKK